jgi:hypothetical protein
MSRTIIFSLLVTLGLVAGACSGGDADPGVVSFDVEQANTPSAETGSIPGEQAVLDFTACLRDEGLDIADPGVDENGNLVPPNQHALAGQTLDMAVLHSAFDVCRELLDNVAFGLNTEDLAEREDELLAFAVCMRENGFGMPDPDFSTDGHTGDGPFGDALDTVDPDFQRAAASCEGIIGG